MYSRKLFTFLLATLAVCNYNVKGNETDVANLVVDPEKIEEMSVLEPVSGKYEHWDDWESWEPSQFVVQTFRCYRSGKDLDGLVVHVAEFGKDDFRALAALPADRKDEVLEAWEQWTRFMEKDAAINNGQGVAVIVDFDGFTLANYASPEALKLSLQVFSFLARQHNTVKYGFLLNVNYAAETWIRIARPFYGSFLDAFEVCGTIREIWKPKLLRKVAANQLPPKYGGSEDWKCVPTSGNRCPV